MGGLVDRTGVREMYTGFGWKHEGSFGQRVDRRIILKQYSYAVIFSYLMLWFILFESDW